MRIGWNLFVVAVQDGDGLTALKSSTSICNRDHTLRGNWG